MLILTTNNENRAIQVQKPTVDNLTKIFGTITETETASALETDFKKVTEKKLKTGTYVKHRHRSTQLYLIHIWVELGDAAKSSSIRFDAIQPTILIRFTLLEFNNLLTDVAVFNPS